MGLHIISVNLGSVSVFCIAFSIKSGIAIGLWAPMQSLLLSIICGIHTYMYNIGNACCRGLFALQGDIHLAVILTYLLLVTNLVSHLMIMCFLCQ